ncbi:MAG TPA: GNAT family N-acetyltransferase [Thermoanaerobaculia bacterium]|jgi:GNAT superfamily N-acetyltransferase
MPAIHFREGTRSDRDAILALRELAFADEDREKQRADFWEWEFVNGYAGAGRVFIAEAEDKVVGHFAFVPQMYDSIRGALAVDVMTHPEFRRQKVFSRLAAYAANRLRDEFPVISAFQIRETVMAGMIAGGWRGALALPVLLKPLSLRGLARDFGLPFGSRLSDAIEERARDAIRPIAESDFDQIDALLATPKPRQRRSAEFVVWRYKRNPHWRYELEGFFEGDKLRAFLIHRETILRGLQTLAIADAGVLRGRETALRQLIKHACRRGRRRKLAVAAALVSRHHPAYRTLRRSGFMAGPHRFRLLLQVFDERLRWLNDAPWSLSWGDTDHL